MFDFFIAHKQVWHFKKVMVALLLSYHTQHRQTFSNPTGLFLTL